jgi:hypothetical protein
LKTEQKKTKNKRKEGGVGHVRAHTWKPSAPPEQRSARRSQERRELAGAQGVSVTEEGACRRAERAATTTERRSIIRVQEGVIIPHRLRFEVELSNVQVRGPPVDTIQRTRRRHAGSVEERQAVLFGEDSREFN